MDPETDQALERERIEVLEQIEEMLETPVRVLGFVWLGLLVVEFLAGESRPLTVAVYSIWVIFLIDFAIRMTLAPRKVDYLRKNWLTVLSLAVPALRVFAIFRALRFLRVARTARMARSLRLVKVLGSINRGMRALRGVMRRRGFGYMALLTVIVTLVGAAGMYVIEGPPGFSVTGLQRGEDSPESFTSYGETLWWTAMLMTTMGSSDEPQTTEGRVLGLVLALYAFGVFGYMTATLATFFIGQEAESPESQVIGAETVETLRAEIRSLREELASNSPVKGAGGDS